jgi:hypothetical protein
MPSFRIPIRTGSRSSPFCTKILFHVLSKSICVHLPLLRSFNWIRDLSLFGGGGIDGGRRKVLSPEKMTQRHHSSWGRRTWGCRGRCVTSPSEPTPSHCAGGKQLLTRIFEGGSITFVNRILQAPGGAALPCKVLLRAGTNATPLWPANATNKAPGTTIQEGTTAAKSKLSKELVVDDDGAIPPALREYCILVIGACFLNGLGNRSAL